MAAEDRAVARTLLGGVLAVLDRSYSSRPEALAQCRDLLDDLELAGPPCNSAPRHGGSATPAAADEVSQAAKDLKTLRRLKIHVARVEARVAGSTDASGPDLGPHGSSTPAPPLPAQASCSVEPPAPILAGVPPDSPVAELDFDLVPKTPPKTRAPSTASALDELDLACGPVARWECGVPVLSKKIPKKYDGFSFPKPRLPNTPSPPHGVLKRNASACVKSTLQGANQQHRIDSAGVSYIAGLLVKNEEEDWVRIILTWGMEVLDNHDATGEWRL